MTLRYHIIKWAIVIIGNTITGFMHGWKAADVWFLAAFVGLAAIEITLAFRERQRVLAISRLPPSERQQWLAKLGNLERRRMYDLLGKYAR